MRVAGFRLTSRIGASSGSRTRLPTLGRLYITDIRYSPPYYTWFDPSLSHDLTCHMWQSVLATPQTSRNFSLQNNGADDGNRTCDLLVTSELLYQLSYVGTCRILTEMSGLFIINSRKSRQRLFHLDFFLFGQ